MRSQLAPGAVEPCDSGCRRWLRIIASGALAGCQCVVLTPSSVLDDDEVPTAGMWRGCLQGYSVPLMGKRGESRLPAAGGSGNDRGSRLLCPVYTWAGGCETARRKREVHTSYLPHFALNVKILKV